MATFTHNVDNISKKIAMKHIEAQSNIKSEKSTNKNKQDFKENVEDEKQIKTIVRDSLIKCNQDAGTSTSLDTFKKSHKNNVAKEIIREGEDIPKAVIKKTQKINNLVYQKRPGTAGVSGQLYETKLLSLVLLRALNDKTIEEFYLGTNIGGIGALDDICLRYKSKENNKNVIIFIQAKHRNDVDKGKITLKDVQKNNGDFSLAKYFDSYLQIRDKITPTSRDVMFKGDMNDLDCYFIIYTPVKHNIIKDSICFEENNSDTSQHIRKLIETDTRGDIFQLKFDDVNFLINDLIENRIKLLGKIFLDLILDDNKIIMDNEIIKRYHVVLAHYVIEISDDILEGSRKGIFRPDFFNNHEKFIGKFRETLYGEVIKRRPLHSEDDVSLKFYKIFECQTAENISNVIGNHIDYDEKSNRFILIDKREISVKNFGYLLKDKQVNPSIVKDAIEIAGKKILSTLEFKLPIWFGNKDIAVRGNALKVEKRLDFLASELFKLFKNSTSHDGIHLIEINDNIVGPNKLLEKGVVEQNGGLGSAVGNLLIIDRYTSTLKFHNTESLPTNAKTVWEKLKSKASEKDLIRCRFKICILGFPTLSFVDDSQEKKLLEDFVSKLWYYTRQAKETTVEDIVKKEIDKHFKMEINTTPIFRLKTNAIFLKIHDEIQKWWLQSDNINYFNQNTDILNRAMLDIVDNPISTMFNLIYVNKLKTFGIEFESDAIKSLNLDTFTSGLLIITTDSNILTGAKLIEHFKNSRNHVFVDFNYILSFTLHTLDSILSEFEKIQFETLIISLEVTNNDEIIFEKLNYFLNKLNNDKIIIVTTKFQLELSNSKKNIELRNDKTNLNNLSPISRQKILNESMVVFQGAEVTLKAIIDDESEYLITADTLRKLLNKQVLEIGKPLTTSNYDKIEPFYVHRHLSREENYISHIDLDNEGAYEQETYLDDDYMSHSEEPIVKSYEVNSLKDLKDDIVVVTATPGMGKSTLLTHLSLETKKIYPNTWIARINLLDYSKQFNKWQQNKTIVDEKETISFLCRATTNANNNNELEFSVINNEIVLIRDNIDSEALLELDLFFHCYKNGKIIYLFDGFDEICPHYEREVIQLMKATVNITFASSVEKNIKAWITSRSYNNVKHIIEREFGKSYTLEPLSKIEQRIYLEKFWKINMNLKSLSYEQFANIDSFITYMRSIDNKETHTMAYVKSISKPLHNMYVAAVEYFRNEIKSIPLSEDSEIFRQAWDIDTTQPLILNELFRHKKNVTKALKLSGSPLHMHIAAEYFQNEIKHNLSSDQNNKWDLDMNTFAFYERFLEMKLTKIRFEEKNKIDVCKPDNKILHDKERKDFIEEHKKLAFYAIFKDYNIFNELITEDEIQEIKDMVDSLKFANEKTGVIDCVVDDVPRFVHRIFAEYFAIEYVCDLIKTAFSLKCLNRLEIIWKFLFCAVMTDGAIGAFTIFNHKLANNDKLAFFLRNADTNKAVYDLLSKQTSVDFNEDHSMFDDEVYDSSYYRTALDVAVENGLSETAKFILTCVEKHLNKDNMKYFVCALTENKLIHSAIAQGFDDIIDIIFNNLRRIDDSKMYTVLFDNDFCYGIFVNILDKTNAEIIADLYSTYNHRIDLKIVSFHAKILEEICNDEFTRQHVRIPQDFFTLFR